MEDDLISKKDLLELAGISYGQLYRWKRKNLIPEDWFVRRSTFTGQETFFPRAKILQRIAKIMNMKEDLSLDELADVFSPEPASIEMDGWELVRRGIVSKEALALYEEVFASTSGLLSFDHLLSIYILHGFLDRGDMVLDEGRKLLGILQTQLNEQKGLSGEVLLVRKLGISIVLATANRDTLWLEDGLRVLARSSIAVRSEELKLKLGAGGHAHDQ
ncbi:YhbD family protein [Gorillibacterium sp. CAU 1737]|uniref:YhbD family protein n=1 Tax=Gorillibacterium sp. CAU 1737 TaxID=3140362 RepID=UPI00326018EB